MDVMQEEQVAVRLGVSRETLGKVRAQFLFEGTHWEKTRRGFLYTAEGEVEARARLGVDEKKAAAGAGPRAGEPFAVKVVVVPEQNPKLLEARTEAGVTVMVRVQSNVKFVPGMTMKVVPGLGREADFVGRLPRFRGQW